MTSARNVLPYPALPMGQAMPRIFISHSSKDRRFADDLLSDWVQLEVKLALEDPRYVKRAQIVPVLARPCDWKTIHPDINRYNLVDFSAGREEALSRLLHFWQVDRHLFPQFQVGDVLMPV